MRRTLLIAGGTLGGLGAVLAITPPNLGAPAGNLNSLASANTPGTPVALPASPTPTASSVASSVATPSRSSTPTPAVAVSTPTHSKSAASATAITKKATPAKNPAAPPSPVANIPTASQSATPTPSPTTPAPIPATPVVAGVSGSFTGASYDANQGGQIWGRVTVTVSLKDGEISNISAVQNPASRSYGAFQYLTPAVLNQKLSVKTVMAMSPSSLVGQIRGYTGASYSSYAYWQSLQSALSKAGF